MSRRGIFADLGSDEKLTAVNSPPLRGRQMRTSGAFGSVVREIDALAAKAEAAREIEARLTAGEIVVDLDPSEIDASFVADRLSQDDDEFQALVQALRERGQDSPVLVRRHPSDENRYQIAFGHRRVRAANILGRKVRAVVKQLTDRDLVLAQGQENSARANLSFIEQALFARRLEDLGHDRETIMSALGVDKTVVSRMISVASKLPTPLIEAIGAARGRGRDRWVELASEYEKASVDRQDFARLTSSEAFVVSESDGRFELALTFFSDPNAPLRSDTSCAARRSTAEANFWANGEGHKIARIKADRRNFTVSIDERAAPGFGDFLLKQMDRLYASYQSETRETPAE